MVTIIPTSTARHLAKGLSGQPGFKIVFPGRNRDGKYFFPDGERYAKIAEAEKLKGRVVVLHSGSPEPSNGLIELKIILEILKNAKVKQIELFFTYFPYAMQDKIKDKGEVNFAECLVKEFIGCYKVKKIYVIDAHFYNDPWAKRYPIINISAADMLIKRAKEDYPDLALVTPDEGAKRRLGISGVRKKRLNSYKIEFNGGKFKTLKNKTIGVIDDILETGGTMDKFLSEAKKSGAKAGIALITHAVLSQGINRIKKTYQACYFTNSIGRKGAKIDITPLIAKALAKE